MAQLLKWKETRKTWRSQASRVWPSSLHNKCSNSECNHPNHPQVKEGKYVCDGVATNAFFCQGTYRVSRKRARESADYWRRNTRDDQEYIETVAQIVVRREDTISRRARENAEYINEERGRMEASEEAREFYRKRREQRRRERSSGTQEPRWRQYRQDSTERDLDITPQSSTGRHSNIEGADTSHTPRPTQHAHVVASTAASQSSLITPLFSASAEVTRTTSGESITKSEGIALVTKQANQGKQFKAEHTPPVLANSKLIKFQAFPPFSTPPHNPNLQCETDRNPLPTLIYRTTIKNIRAKVQARAQTFPDQSVASNHGSLLSTAIVQILRKNLLE